MQTAVLHVIRHTRRFASGARWDELASILLAAATRRVVADPGAIEAA